MSSYRYFGRMSGRLPKTTEFNLQAVGQQEAPYLSLEVAAPSGINAVLQGTLDGISGQFVADVSGSVPITEVGSGSQRAQISVLNISSQGLAFPANVTAGDLLVCLGRCWHSTTPHTSIAVTDTLGTTYSVYFVDESTSNDSQFIAYGIAPSSGSNTVTVTPNSFAETLSFAIDEFAGVDTANPLSVAGSTSSASSTSASDSLTTLTAGELVLGVMGHTGTTPTITPNNTQIAENENNNTEEAFAAAYQIAGAPGSYSISWTIGSAVFWTASTLSLKPTVAGTTVVLQGTIDGISGQLSANTATNATLQGGIGDLSGVIDIVPVVPSTDVTLQGSVGDLSGSIVANVSINATLQGSLEDISGQIVSSTATNTTLQGTLGEISGSISANTSTDVTLQGSFEDISGSIVTGAEAVNVSLQGSFDDISGQLQANISTSATIQGSFDGISGQLQATSDIGALLQGSIGDLNGALVANTSTNVLLQGDLEGISGTITTSLLTAVDVVLTGGLGDISGFIDATVTDTPLEVIRVKGVGKKSNKKALTYSDRKELDEKVFEVLFDLAKDVADKADISDSLVTSDVVSNLVNDVVNDVRTSDISKIVLEESAKLQTDLILRNLRRKQRNREDEELMLLF